MTLGSAPFQSPAAVPTSQLTSPFVGTEPKPKKSRSAQKGKQRASRASSAPDADAPCTPKTNPAARVEKGEKENAAPGLMADARRHVQSGLFGREYTAPPPKPKKASKAPLAAESTNNEGGLQQPRLSPFGFVPSCDPAYVRDKKAKEETSKTGLARGASVDLEGDGGVSYNDRHRTAVVDNAGLRQTRLSPYGFVADFELADTPPKSPPPSMHTHQRQAAPRTLRLT